MCLDLHTKKLPYFAELHQTQIFSTDFIKVPNIKLHDIPSVEAELLHAGDGHTDRYDEANNHFSEFFKGTCKLTSRSGKVQLEAILNGFNNWY